MPLEVVVRGGLDRRVLEQYGDVVNVDGDTVTVVAGNSVELRSRILSGELAKELGGVWSIRRDDDDEPTPHQRDRLENVKDAPHVHVRGPAGAGKTLWALVRLDRDLTIGRTALFVTRSRALAFFAGKRLHHHLKIFYVLSDKKPRRFEVTTVRGRRRLTLREDDNEPKCFDVVVVDEAHHVYKAGSDVGAEVKRFAGPETRWLLLSDMSQASDALQHVDHYPDVEFTTVELTEVVRCSQRIVAGAMAFQLGGKKSSASFGQKNFPGPPLKTFIFDNASDDDVIRAYADHVIQAMDHVRQTMLPAAVNLHNRILIAVRDERFRDLLKPLLEKKYHLVSSVDATSVLDDSSDDDSEHPWLVYDTIDEVDGLERLVVICVGLDATGATNERRSALYRGLTRGQLGAVVVNEFVKGGWLEFLGHVRYGDGTMNVETELQRAKKDAADCLALDEKVELLRSTAEQRGLRLAPDVVQVLAKDLENVDSVLDEYSTELDLVKNKLSPDDYGVASRVVVTLRRTPGLDLDAVIKTELAKARRKHVTSLVEATLSSEPSSDPSILLVLSDQKLREKIIKRAVDDVIKESHFSEVEPTVWTVTKETATTWAVLRIRVKEKLDDDGPSDDDLNVTSLEAALLVTEGQTLDMAVSAACDRFWNRIRSERIHTAIVDALTLEAVTHVETSTLVALLTPFVERAKDDKTSFLGGLLRKVRRQSWPPTSRHVERENRRASTGDDDDEPPQKNKRKTGTVVEWRRAATRVVDVWIVAQKGALDAMHRLAQDMKPSDVVAVLERVAGSLGEKTVDEWLRERREKDQVTASVGSAVQAAARDKRVVLSRRVEAELRERVMEARRDRTHSTLAEIAEAIVDDWLSALERQCIEQTVWDPSANDKIPRTREPRFMPFSTTTTDDKREFLSWDDLLTVFGCLNAVESYVILGLVCKRWRAVRTDPSWMPRLVVYAWGSTYSGSAQGWTAKPELLKMSLKVVSIVCANYATLALTSMGDVYHWGQPWGDRDPTMTTEPTKVPGLADVKAISCTAPGYFHRRQMWPGFSCAAVTVSGDLYTWGENKARQLFHDDPVVPIPTKVDLSKYQDDDLRTLHVACGLNFLTLQVQSSQTGSCCVLVHGRYEVSRRIFSKVSPELDAVGPLRQLVAGAFHALALTTQGDVFAFGHSEGLDISNGDLLGTDGQGSGFISSSNIGPVAEVAASTYSSLLITVDGRLFTWGDCDGNALGDTRPQGIHHPQWLSTLRGTRIAHGALSYTNGAVVTDQGSVYVWGGEAWEHGIAQPPDRRPDDPLRPIPWPGLPPAYLCSSIALGHNHGFLLFQR